MSVNDMTFNQIAAVLQSVVNQATGVSVLTPTNTSEFVTVAQTALKTGYDPILNAISQVLSRTIFSIRPYYRKFGGIEVSESAWGNMVRKLSIADKNFQNDARYAYPVGYDGTQTPASGDGKSVDMYTINKPDVLQTNFYGANVFSDCYTVFKDQLECAFQSPDGFASFLAMVQQNQVDKLEQARENIARATVVNFIGGIIAEGQTSRIVHLLTEYNAATGLTLTAQSIYQPANYAPFMQWVYARIAGISAMMTERSEMYQTVVNGKHIMRHTPVDRQHVYLYAGERYNTEAMVLADTYHDNYLRYVGDVETVNFWQSIETPGTINVTPGYIGSTGEIVTPAEAVNQGNVYGVIFDGEALGYATTQQWSQPTPFNAKGGYTNIWTHETERNWNDHTEKGVVLLLD